MTMPTEFVTDPLDLFFARCNTWWRWFLPSFSNNASHPSTGGSIRINRPASARRQRVVFLFDQSDASGWSIPTAACCRRENGQHQNIKHPTADWSLFRPRRGSRWGAVLFFLGVRWTNRRLVMRHTARLLAVNHQLRRLA